MFGLFALVVRIRHVDIFEGGVAALSHLCDHFHISRQNSFQSSFFVFYTQHRYFDPLQPQPHAFIAPSLAFVLIFSNRRESKVILLSGYHIY